MIPRCIRIRILTYINSVLCRAAFDSLYFVYFVLFNQSLLWETKDKDSELYYLKWPKQNEKSATISCDCCCVWLWFEYYSLKCDETVTFCCRLIFFCHCVRTNIHILRHRHTHTNAHTKFKRRNADGRLRVWCGDIDFLLKKISGVLFCFAISMSNSNLLAIVCVIRWSPNESRVLNESCIYLSHIADFRIVIVFFLAFSTFMQML